MLRSKEMAEGRNGDGAYRVSPPSAVPPLHIQRLPVSPALTKRQNIAAACGKKYRAAIKGLFDNMEMVLNDLSDNGHMDMRDVGNSEALSQRLLMCTRRMYSFCLRDRGVDYELLKTSQVFAAYVREVRTLWLVNPSELNEQSRKAFFLNVYNSLVIHAKIAFGNPSTSTERMHFYSRASYVIGGRLYSLNDIEHGVLRGNSTSWQPIPIRPFGEYDARNKCVLELDPRIHFALNCGAWGCPAINFYNAENLDAALDAATRLFLSNVIVNAENRCVVLSSIFQWYASDFGRKQSELLEWVMPYLDEPGKSSLGLMLESFAAGEIADIRISYAPYDWGLNSVSDSQ